MMHSDFLSSDLHIGRVWRVFRGIIRAASVIGRRVIFPSAATCLLALVAVAPPATAQTVPSEAAGIWAQRPCAESRNTYFLVNSSFVLILDNRDADTQVVLGPAQWAGGAPMLARPEGVALLPPVSTMNRCPALPFTIYAVLGEAVTAFSVYDQVSERCATGSARTCIEAAFAAIDVSNDRRLSTAEVNRALRAAAPFLAYEAIVANRQASGPDPMRRLRVGLAELSTSTVLASIGGPFVTSTVMQAYDYDGDGSLSLAEILQDRGPLDTVRAADGVTIVGTHAGLQTLIRGLPSALNNLSSLLGGLLR